MTWNSLGKFELSQDWTFSEPVEGEIFRIFHQPIEDLPKGSLRGVITQGFRDSQSFVNTFAPKLFTYGNDYELFSFYFPVGFSEHSIILKRLDNNPANWIVEVQVFQAENPTQDYENYLLSRFGREAITQFNQSLNMHLTPLLYSGSTAPESKTVTLKANHPVVIFPENEARTTIRMYSEGHPILLATGFDEAGKPLEVLAQLPPNYAYEDVISTAGMYKGNIFALCEQDSSVLAIEFSAK